LAEALSDAGNHNASYFGSSGMAVLMNRLSGYNGLEPTKVTSFTMILYNSGNNIPKLIANKFLVMFELPHCSRFEAILSSILSQQRCEVYFISLAVAKPI